MSTVLTALYTIRRTIKLCTVLYGKGQYFTTVHSISIALPILFSFLCKQWSHFEINQEVASLPPLPSLASPPSTIDWFPWHPSSQFRPLSWPYSYSSFPPHSSLVLILMSGYSKPEKTRAFPAFNPNIRLSWKQRKIRFIPLNILIDLFLVILTEL